MANTKRSSKELPILSRCPLCNIPLWQGQPAISRKSKWSQSIWNGIIAIAIIQRYVKTWKIIVNVTKIHQMVFVVLLYIKIHRKTFLRYILEICTSQVASNTGTLFPKLFSPTVRKNCPNDRENFWNSRLKAENLQKFWDH